MIQNPTIEAKCGAHKNPAREEWLATIFKAASVNVANGDERPPEACYWPGSIIKMDDDGDILTVYWYDGISMVCYRWAFTAAWAEYGDATTVLHKAIDELDDREREPFEVVE